MMAQWHACKKKAPNAVLLFRLGDFYEAFYEDAHILSEDAGVALTKRQDIPMAGVPCQNAENYIEKLIRCGHLIAVAEQLDDPKNTKGIVRRGIVRSISPATYFSDSYLKDKESIYFACITKLNATWSLALAELSTGQLEVSEYSSEKALLDELHRSRPTEILLSDKNAHSLKTALETYTANNAVRISTIEHWHFDHKICHDFLTNHFKVLSLDGFGMKGMTAGTIAAGGLLSYIADRLGLSITHILSIRTIQQSTYMAIDQATQKNLELTTPLHAQTAYTLFGLLDTTKTPMGARLLARWITRPLITKSHIAARQDAVEALLNAPSLAASLRKTLAFIKDIERLAMRIATASATPRDVVALRRSLEPIDTLSEQMDPLTAELFAPIKAALALELPTAIIAEMLNDEPPARLADGNVIRSGYDEALDELRTLKSDSRQYLVNYQQTLKEKLGIKTLKISYNKAFGYYIEVSKAQAHAMPETFERRQTLVNAERFISPHLKEYEQKILVADEQIATAEAQHFARCKERVAAFIPTLSRVAENIAHLDALLALAGAAENNSYIRPIFSDNEALDIVKGRHPIIENALTEGSFIPNNTHLNANDTAMMLITGPNMAGKSTYIRQVALIAIMAQMGSFVPAESATLPLFDKVFSRIGASDDLSRGQSTFMVEMTETANILHNATEQSLVILDEIGRGTSTYDGISIAWAVADYLLSALAKPVKTLFATHYWELTELAAQGTGAANFHVAVRETGKRIIFLHTIVQGGTDKSYGIHVARLAGLPYKAINKAQQMLEHLRTHPAKESDTQLTLFDIPQQETEQQLRDKIAAIDPDALSPKEALELIYTLKTLV